MKQFVSKVALAAAALSLIPLSACTKVEEDGTETAADVENRTLAAAITGADGLSTVSSAIADAGLSTVFDGPGSYTVFAPDDDAFGTLGDEAEGLTTDEERPVLVAVLRDHIVPGHLTLDAIGKAIDDQGGKVQMKTVGDGTITFTRTGEDIVLTGDDGSSAKIDGPAITASNGVAIPVDGLLKPLKPA